MLSGETRASSPLASDKGCVVSLIQDVAVPARQSGVLTQIPVRLGAAVKKGQLLAQLDDAQAQHDLEIARRNQEISRLAAESTVDVDFAEMTEHLAMLEYERAVQANAHHGRAVTDTDLEKLRFDWERSKLQILQAQREFRKGQIEYEIRSRTFASAHDSVASRQIVAPSDGVIVEILRQEGEWVNPGDSVLRLVRFDQLRVKAFLQSSEFLPSEIQDRPARIESLLARGKTQTFSGRVVFVNPTVDSDGKFAVWIDVENRQENGAWLLAPGKQADVWIETSAPGR
jgi:multidrug efflux pump subunit AcrA (membrane-fusion protein)